MKLEKLTIKNFKSLADVTIEPSDLTVIIGPNGSGKTNLANAFAFLKEVYANGLETAVQRSGGFENIASVSGEGVKNIISFKVSFILTFSEFLNLIDRKDFFDLDKALRESIISSGVVITHYFSIASDDESRKNDFTAHEEVIKILVNEENELMTVERSNSKKNQSASSLSKKTVLEFKKISGLHFFRVPLQQLLITAHPALGFFLRDLISFTSNWNIYQLLPNTAKAPGVPTPNPTLSFYGNNLPVLVDHMVRKEPEVWQSILDTMRRVVPTLTDIKTGYLYNKTVGLFFYEEGFDRPWNAEEVSDGTILTLAMLCSVNDPRTTLVFIEEPENSLHPWILRELLQNFKGVAEKKDIMVTTHSPTLIDMVAPNDIWCISKADRKTQLNRLTDIAENLQSDWEAGIYKTSDYLDSGLVAQAIPGGSI